jgi:hypothetical protein
MLMRVLLLLLACAASLTAHGQPPRDLRPSPPSAGTAEIRGRVLAADTGAPVPGAVVNLIRAPTSSPAVTTGIMSGGSSQEAGPDGRYVFTGVSAGEYFIGAGDAESRASYLRTLFGATGLQAPGTSVTVADGQRVDGIDIRLAPAAVIAGQVVDDAGLPVARTAVSALRWTGSRPVRAGPRTTTDDRGFYRLFGLSPGDYMVAAEARPAPPNRERRTALMTTFSPGATGVAAARVVRALGGEVVEADIRMVRSHRIRLGGLLLDVRGQPVANGNVTLALADSLDTRGTSAVTDAHGRFSFRDLAPGPYRLVGRAYFSGQPPPGAGRELALMDLHLLDDVEDLVVMSQPGASVRLDVQFESQPPEGMRVNFSAVSAERGESLLDGRAPATVTGPGSVVLPDLFGPVLFRASGMSPQWIVKEVRHRGRDITDAPTVFGRQDVVEVVLSDRAATVEGTAADSAGRSAGAGDMVLVFGMDPAVWVPQSSKIRAANVVSGGRFSVHGLRPGTYFVAALPFADAVNLSEPSPAALQALAAHATQVVVGDGERRRLELTMVEGANR